MTKSSSRQNSLEKAPTTWQKYRYTPLSSSPGTIRLLRLFSAPDTSTSWPIHCHLFTTALETAPPYTALSYSWGDKSGTQSIFLDSDTMTVTPNLKNALQRLRPNNGEKELLLWVDAICINQSDIPERNSQTANMRRIYECADSVAVWLGMQSHHSKDAFELTKSLNACPAEKVRELLEEERTKDRLDGLVSLFRRQYWWRVWVIQEVSAAKQATVYCGEDAIDWVDLEDVCDILKKQEERLGEIYYRNPSFPRTLTDGGPRALQLSRYSPNSTAPPLREILISHKSKKATDPRDKVYALVGISEDRDTFGRIDYSLSIKDTYVHTARHIITTTKKLDVICVKQHDINPFDLPSWAPDWTRPPSNSGATIIGLHHYKGTPMFAAAGTTSAEITFRPNDVLEAKGILVDTITNVGTPYKKRGRLPSNTGQVTALLEIFHEWWSIYFSCLPNTLASQVRFGRAISCGNWQFEDDEMYEKNLEAIFQLSEDMLSESDLLRLNPISRTNTMGSENSLGHGDGQEPEAEEKTRIAAVISVGLTMNRRRLFLTKEERIGLASQNAAVGDLVCVLLGCRFPVVLRPHEDGSHSLIGEAYLEDFMNGEAVVGSEKSCYTLERFHLC